MATNAINVQLCSVIRLTIIMSWPYGLRAEPTGAQHITSNIVTLFQ